MNQPSHTVSLCFQYIPIPEQFTDHQNPPLKLAQKKRPTKRIYPCCAVVWYGLPSLNKDSGAINKERTPIFSRSTLC